QVLAAVPLAVGTWHTLPPPPRLLGRATPCRSVFFYRPGPHRDLHSFPTRRSSDLSTSSRSGSNPRPIKRARKSGTVGSCSVAARSEEHTSELQSREKLVCRLLLEKKKRARGASSFITCSTIWFREAGGL